MKKKALVFGAGGFIGSSMVSRLVSEGYWVRGVDLKLPEFADTSANEFIIGDLTDISLVRKVIRFKGYSGNHYISMPDHLVDVFDEIYQFAADMGGAGYIFTGDNDANIMQNSASINLNLLSAQLELNQSKGLNRTKIFYSSSACIYPLQAQENVENPGLKESDAYPANPDSEYGWEKLFSERLYMSYNRNYGIPVAIARYHNIYGPGGTFVGGKEKAPAAICRKVIQSNDKIEIWGDGKQTRSFLYIDDCIEATRRLMATNFAQPINIGSDEMVSINELVDIVSKIENKSIAIDNIDGPTGVRGRNSDNELSSAVLGWKHSVSLADGISRTYHWIKQRLYNGEANIL